MKKIALLLPLLICGFIPSSCENTDETDTFPPDKSLAGSITMTGYQFEAEGSYSGTALTDYKMNYSSLSIDKLSDTEIDLSSNSRWGNTRINIYIPTIQLFGNPYDVSFNSTSENATVKYDNIKTVCAIVNIKGWIKQIDNLNSASNNLNSKGADPATPDYSCEINISCNINDEPLKIIIKSAKFQF